MSKTENQKYTIRNYIDTDADKIAEFDFLSMLAYRYNRDYEASNIFCAVDANENIVGIGHLEPDQTWFLIDKNTKPSHFVYKLNLSISLNGKFHCPIEIKDELFSTLLNRAKEIRNQYPDKNVTISHTIPSDEIDEIDYFLAKGFYVIRNHLIMKRDLTEEIPTFPITDPIKIINWKMDTEAEQEKYLRAEAESDDNGVSWSLNRLQWTKNGSEWDTFTAFAGDKIVGSVMTWGLDEGRSATENIFVLHEWRRKGIAKAVIIEALKFLKSKGKTEATLGVFGENQKAIALYRALGYKMLFINIEFGLDL